MKALVKIIAVLAFLGMFIETSNLFVTALIVLSCAAILAICSRSKVFSEDTNQEV